MIFTSNRKAFEQYTSLSKSFRSKLFSYNITATSLPLAFFSLGHPGEIAAGMHSNGYTEVLLKAERIDYFDVRPQAAVERIWHM